MEYFNKRNLVCAVVSSFSVYKLWKMYQKYLKKERLNYKCIFFSPNQMGCTIMCKENLNELNKSFICNNCSLNILTSYLMKANKCLDICLYLVTSEKLCNVILNLFKLGVYVRIIVDKNISEEAFGAKALLFQKAYVPLKIIECSHMMHNKFAIIDNETVMTGSLNWTNAGFYGHKNSKLIKGHEEKNFSSKITQKNKLLEDAKPKPPTPQWAKSKISATSDKTLIPSPVRGVSQSARCVKTDSATVKKKIGNRSTISEKGFGPPQKKTDQEQNVKVMASIVSRFQSSVNTIKSSSADHQKFLGLRRSVKNTVLEKTDVKNIVSIPKPEKKQNENLIDKKYSLEKKIISRKIGRLKKSISIQTAKTEVENATSKSSSFKKSSTNLPKCGKSEVGNSDEKVVLPNPKLQIPSSNFRKTIFQETPEKSRKLFKKSQEVKRMKSEGDSLHFQHRPSPLRRMAMGPRNVASEIENLNLRNKLKEKPHFTLKVNSINKESAIKSKAKKEITSPSSRVVSKPALKNDVVHMNAMTDAKLSGKTEEKEEAEIKVVQNQEQSQVLPPPDNSATPTNEIFERFDSLEKANYDELNDLDQMIWNDLEKKIREAYEQGDDFNDSDEESGDSLSDIISKLSLNEEKKEAEKCKKEKSVAAIVHEKRVPESDPVSVRKAVPVIFESKKRNLEHKSEWDVQEPHNNIKDSLAKTEPTEKEEPKMHDFLNVNQSEVLNEDIIKEFAPGHIWRETPSSPMRFFKTNKKLGFIGKVEDEECVSFDVGQVKLYQPYENQMLFYDVANCIATQAYLKICGMNYELEMRKNAEQMSPSGKIPFLSSCLCIIPEFEGIISFMQCKKFSNSRIEENDKNAFRAIISMIKNTLESAERYICWYDEETIINYTKPRIGCMFPFPLNHILYWLKSYEERRNIKNEGRREISIDVILREINACFRVLSQRLGNNNFFFGNISTEIDALVYGHIYALVTTEKEGIFKDLHLIIKQFPNLITFAINFDKTHLLNKFPPVDFLSKTDS